MEYTVTIHEIIPKQGDSTYDSTKKIFEQMVEDLDIKAVVSVVNGINNSSK